MIKNSISIIIGLIVISCNSPSDKIKKIILYNDSVGYWNYEWPRERADFYGMTFQLDDKGRVKQFSYDKIENRRSLFSDFGTQPRMEWGIADDSTFTFMNYNSKIKIMKYNNDTIWLYNNELKRNDMLIKVKGDLNIEK